MLSEAVRSGFTAVQGDVMIGNRAMLLLAGDLGFRRVGMEGGVVRIAAEPSAGAGARTIDRAVDADPQRPDIVSGARVGHDNLRHAARNPVADPVSI
jgi:hypothetical protein